MFVFTQTVRHRDFFLPVDSDRPGPHDEDGDGHADPPSDRAALTSLGLLVLSLLARAAAGVDRRRPRRRDRQGADQPQPRLRLDGPLALGLEPMQITLLFVSVVVAVLTVVPGRAKPLQGGVHLVLLAAFVFVSINP